MRILGIETSCDETAAAVVEDGQKIWSNVVVSQIDIFKAYGGVIPEVAARSHLEAILPVVDQALKTASLDRYKTKGAAKTAELDNLDWSEIDAIAVTHAPGLLGSLLIGTLTARTLAILQNKPLYAVHHLKSHVYANWLENENKSTNPYSTDSDLTNVSCTSLDLVASNFQEPPLSQPQLTAPQFPLLSLVISGGHTQILYMPSHNQFQIIGTTRDDAVGECFDKVAKILGLPYPGGPAISKAAKNGDSIKYNLPHPAVEGLDFSFSGLKTAVLRAVQKELGLPLSFPSHELKDHLSEKQVADFAASFEKTAVLILLEKLEKALVEHPEVKSLVFAGGVSANQRLRSMAQQKFDKTGIRVYFPAPQLSGDNGAMVAAAAYYEIKSGVSPIDPYRLNIYPRVSVEKEG